MEWNDLLGLVMGRLKNMSEVGLTEYQTFVKNTNQARTQ